MLGDTADGLIVDHAEVSDLLGAAPNAAVLGRVKRWVLAMLACKGKLRVAPLPPPRGGAFDSPCAPRPFGGVGTKGVPRSTLRLRRGSNKGLIVREAPY